VKKSDENAITMLLAYLLLKVGSFLVAVIAAYFVEVEQISL
jgi:hypothetical protein